MAYSQFYKPQLITILLKQHEIASRFIIIFNFWFCFHKIGNKIIINKGKDIYFIICISINYAHN